MDKNVENWATKIIEYSVLTHSQHEAANEKSKPIKIEDDTQDKSSDSEHSNLKEDNEEHNNDNNSQNWSIFNSSSKNEIVSHSY